MNRISWLEIVEEAFGETNVELHLNEIYKRVYHLISSKYHEKQSVKNVEAVVRGTMEKNSKDSDAFNKVNNRFKITRNKGEGYWMMLD